MQHLLLTTPTGEKIHARIDYPDGGTPSKIVLIAHGLAGYKEEPLIANIRDVYLKNDTAAVTYDARFSLGQSGGPLEKACFTHFIQDLEFMVSWIRTSPDFKNASLALSGHSLGAGACLYYAAHHADIKHLSLFSTVYNGNMLAASYEKHKPGFMAQWRADKVLQRTHPVTGKSGGISYNHMSDAAKYELEKQSGQITCPVLIVYGSRDISSTHEINTILFNSLHAPKKMIEIIGGNHTFSDEKSMADIKEGLNAWINRI
ncbi:MAG: alpha/beta hydrolase [Lactobacillales bacterium]|jgi:pimeloyl-ACP methyl ester carboxylesterase|nr:alpha/beta hydrolase [Lactobacillales bacterium]